MCTLVGVEPFKEEYISHNILKGLLKKDVIQKIHCEESKHAHNYIYSAGVPASFFLLLLEGCMLVQAGKDQLQFESRAFSHFGSPALISSLSDPHGEYIPDFTVRPTTDCVVIIITRRQYLAARKATIFEKESTATRVKEEGSKQDTSAQKVDIFSKEWEKAKSSDMENCHSASSGLSSITKLLVKKSNFRRTQLPSDQHELLMSSVTSDISSYSDGSVYADLERQTLDNDKQMYDYKTTSV